MLRIKNYNPAIGAKKSGFAIMFAVIIGTVMLILAVTLFSFVGQQQTGIQSIVNGEVAHFLAEAGINSSIVAVRQSIEESLKDSGTSEKLFQILAQKGDLSDTKINDLLDNTWNKDLKEFSAEVDKDASIEVDVWLRDFSLSETNPGSWADPVAKNGFLVIESTGFFKNSRRVISIRRPISVTSILPGFISKFTMHVADASRSGEGAFNLIRNDYRGMITDGPRPLIVYNHATPDTPLEAANIADVFKNEAEPEIWQKRGWIWLGGRKVRLNLCSGAGDLGEIFHFYDVSNPNVFSPVKFVSPGALLPTSFSSALTLPWDKSSSSIRQVSYSFGHSFVLDGFHDRSSRKDTDAMYEGGILSETERLHYSSKSSILHLYGDARKGYQSRTRVLGQVFSAFPRFANLEITPQEPDVAEMFRQTSPPPLYLLPSIAAASYDNSINLTDILNRRIGGPMLKSGMLFQNHSEYSQLMSRITEQPYAESYNSMQDVYSRQTDRTFPSSNKILSLNAGNDIRIQRDEHVFFTGTPSTANLMRLIDSRSQLEVDSISDFWERFLNESGELELNAVVTIKNPRRLDMQIPAAGKPQPLVVKGGGMIILQEGNLVLRGISCSRPSEALTIALKGTGSVSFSSTQPNHLNLIAPDAELSYGSKFEMFGSLCVGSIYADHRFQGGILRFRSGQDPQEQGYDRFYKIFVDPKDSYWNG